MRVSRRIRLESPFNPHDPLSRLTRIIAASAPPAATPAPGDVDPVSQQLTHVSTERISLATAELRARAAARVDAVDVVLMQTLLKDYRAAVGHLRTVARLTDQRLATVAAAVKEGVRLFSRPPDSRIRAKAPARD